MRLLILAVIESQLGGELEETIIGWMESKCEIPSTLLVILFNI